MAIQPQRTGGEMEEIISRYQNMVYGLALAKTGSPADADEVFQEVFLAYFSLASPSGRSTARCGCCAPPRTRPGG